MTDGQRAVAFRNHQGLQLVGIVHEPARNLHAGTAVVLLSPGIKNRVAPHRLYRKLAMRMAAQGFWVLRFDFYGLGDAEGQLSEQYLRDVYGAIQVGRYVADTRDALDWVAGTYGFQRFILGGLCGGALTGLLEAQDDPRVVGILGIGMPVILDSRDIDVRQYMTRGQLNSLRARYRQKALSPAAWLRFLSFRTDYRLLLRSFSQLFKRSGQAPATTASRAVPSNPPNANPLFPAALFTTASRGCPILMVFSGADRLYWEFEEKFLARHGEAFTVHAPVVDVKVIPAANHVLTFEEWQAELNLLVDAWLAARFPAPMAALAG